MTHKGMTRILAFGLALAVILGTGGLALATATHEGEIAPPAFSDIAGHEAEGALTLLAAMGAYTGDSGLGGPVHPDDFITRAQFCKVVVTAMGWGATAKALGGLRPTFIDEIPTWAWGYVNVAVYRGIINGYADGTFAPSRDVAYTEAVTMLIRAVSGHDKQAKAGLAGWPYNYMFYGVDNGFTGDVDVGFSSLPATRGDLARMVVATMEINKLNKDGGTIADSAVLAGHVYEGAVKSYGEGTIEIGTTHLPLADLVYLVGADSYEALRNLNVRAVTDSQGDCFFIEVTEDSAAVAGVFKSLGDTDGDHKNDCLVFTDGTKVPYPEDADGDNDELDVTINHETGLTEGDLVEGDQCVAVLGDKGLAVYASALRFAPADWIEKFTAADPAAHPAKNTLLDLHKNGDLTVPATCQVTINGARAGRDDLKVYDCVYVAYEGIGPTVLVTETDGDDHAPVPIAIKAVRELVQGTVISTSISYPKEIHRVTIDKQGGSRQTYVIDFEGGIVQPHEGDTVRYGLEQGGAVFVPIGVTTLTPYVVVKSFTMEGSGRWSATFDVRGTLVTYRLGPDPEHPAINLAEQAGYEAYGWVKVNAATGVVSEWEEYEVGGYFEVVATDPARGNMTLRYTDGEGTHYTFIDDPSAVVYKVATDDSKVYIGIAGLHAGDWVHGDDGPDSVIFELTAEPD